MKISILQDGNEMVLTSMEEPVKVFETKALFFTIVSNDFLFEPRIVVGDLEIEFFSEEVELGRNIYKSKERKFFINNAGLASVDILIGDKDEALRVGIINVLSSKVTTERLFHMLKYISNVDNRLLHCCFSKTMLPTNSNLSDFVDLQHKLQATEAALQFIWDNRDRFRVQPCKRVKVKDIVSDYSNKVAIDDRTYDWLFENIDQFQPSTSSARSLFSYFTKEFEASKVLSSEVYDDTDIFENHVILSFLKSVSEFIENIRLSINSGGKEHERSITNDDFTDVSSYVQNYVFEMLSKRTKLLNRADNLCDSCIKFVKKNLTRNYKKNIRPRVTQYVSKNSHYISLFKLIDNWWSMQISDFQSQNELESLLYSVQKLDQVYEFFVLLKILDSFLELNFNFKRIDYLNFISKPSMNVNDVVLKPNDKAYNYYFLISDMGVEIKLFYEPAIYPHYNDIENGELYIVDKDCSELSAEKLFKAKSIRTPDYVLTVKKPDEEIMIYIIDAKFSSYETVLYERLPSKSLERYKKSSSGLVDKYLHGIRVKNKAGHDSMIQGVFGTYISGNPKSISEKRTHGIHQNFSIYGSNPTPPFIDLVKFSPVDDVFDYNYKFFLEAISKI
jgi:hypothetical protein